jgi:protein SCO1/2
VLLLPSALAAAAQEKGSRLAAIEKAPDFALKDTAGKEVSLSGMKGKVVLVGFIFTTCSGACPATTHRMCLVQDGLTKEGLLKDDRVRLVSITLDPARDTPELLRNYMRLYDVDPASWSFLTGPVEQVNKTVAAWGMWAKPAPNGQLDHPSRVYLVDGRGMIREIYNLDFLRPRWVVEDIRLLLSEK